MSHKITDASGMGGDGYERRYYDKFVKSELPSYEEFWSEFVWPLTKRPASVHFEGREKVEKMGKGDGDVCIAQLHYTLFRHLARAFDLKEKLELSVDDMAEGFARLTGALDVAFELLERFVHPRTYNPWEDKASKAAKEMWQKSANYPLKDIRTYRNHLIHGRIMPNCVSTLLASHEEEPSDSPPCGDAIHSASPPPSGTFEITSGWLGTVWVPRLGCEARYCDWREVTACQAPPPDFDTPKNVLSDAWHKTVQYVEAEWERVLLPRLHRYARGPTGPE